jgi:hypothetical protein
MITLFYGVAAAALVWWLSKQFAKANPATLAKRLKQAGGGAALIGAGVMLVRGRFDMAFLLGGAAAWLFGWSQFTLPGFGGRAAKRPGAVSRVRSAMVEMELDHDTGEMNGTVLAGALSGRALNDLDEAALKRLYEECRQSDPDGVRLLEAYFDRRFPSWREHAERDRDSRPGGPPQGSVMTEEEAYQILGLQPGATDDEIRRAHRTLMKKLHPDQGGTTYLAARINEAKEILLSRHR